MPYASQAQERLMRGVAHSKKFAEKVGIPQAVGRKFEAHKAEGGTVAESKKMIFAGKEAPAEERKEKVAAKKAGMSYKAAEKKFEGAKFPGKYAKGGGIESKGRTKGKMVKMMGGGRAC